MCISQDYITEHEKHFIITNPQAPAPRQECAINYINCIKIAQQKMLSCLFSRTFSTVAYKGVAYKKKCTLVVI